MILYKYRIVGLDPTNKDEEIKIIESKKRQIDDVIVFGGENWKVLEEL